MAETLPLPVAGGREEEGAQALCLQTQSGHQITLVMFPLMIVATGVEGQGMAQVVKRREGQGRVWKYLLWPTPPPP